MGLGRESCGYVRSDLAGYGQEWTHDALCLWLGQGMAR